MNSLRSLLIALLVLNITGCAGALVAGAATTVNVVTDPRTSMEILKDQDISFTIAGMGNKPPFQNNIRVSANTFRGRVLLMGQAVNQDYKDRISSEVRKIKGVKTVYNQMKVMPLLSVGDISKDVWITTKVKSALIANEELRKVKITVYTEAGEVFLVGAVSRHHADIAVDIARNISGVKRVIKAFYYGEQQNVKQEATSDKQQPAPAEELTDSKPAGEENQIEAIPFIEPVEDAPLVGEDDL